MLYYRFKRWVKVYRKQCIDVGDLETAMRLTTAEGGKGLDKDLCDKWLDDTSAPQWVRDWYTSAPQWVRDWCTNLHAMGTFLMGSAEAAVRGVTWKAPSPWDQFAALILRPFFGP